MTRWQAQFPGVEFNFSQYIEDNVEEAASGVKGENSVKLFGNDLADAREDRRQDQGRDERRCRASPISRSSTRSASRPSRSTSTARAPRATGSRPATSTRRSQAAIGGQAAGNLYEEGSDRNFPIIVRLAPRIPPEPRGDPPHHDRRAEPERQRHRADPAYRRRHGQAGLRRLLHLPREPGALYPDQVQRARARSRQRRAGGAAERSHEQVQLPGGLPPRMGRRVRRICRTRSSACRSSCR